jgi:serine/threonine protein kinase
MASFQERYVCGYHIGKTLGKGMSGKVKLGTRESDGAQFALKFIDRASLQVKQMEMLSREIQAMNLLSHPNILTLQQVFSSFLYQNI